jgi:hypothetical protein
MSNKKVYLAKNILASGFDVEYVKSSLLRIPGIDIIEPGMGILPRECASFVIIPDADFVLIDDEALWLSKNVSKDLKDFLKHADTRGAVEGCVYIFSHKEQDEDPNDVEAFYVRMLNLVYADIEVIDKENYNNYSQIVVEDNEDELLTQVCFDIEVNSKIWMKIPLHHQPKPEYAMPPVPTLEERRLKKVPLLSHLTDKELAISNNNDFSSGDKRLLLLRRK